MTTKLLGKHADSRLTRWTNSHPYWSGTILGAIIWSIILTIFAVSTAN